MGRLTLVCLALIALSVLMVTAHALSDWSRDCYWYADCGITERVPFEAPMGTEYPAGVSVP